MSRDGVEALKGGVFKRTSKRVAGLFIDGVGLDRATRRLERKVDLSKLVAGVLAGIQPEVARYYTLIPNEDDSRQFSFLEAVERAGLEVILKRLPPIGVKRQVSMDSHMAADLITFSTGRFADLRKASYGSKSEEARPNESSLIVAPPTESKTEIERTAIVLCPTRELSYAVYSCHLLGAKTSLADFGQYGNSDGWKGIDRWVDLSTSETIWRD